MSKVHTNPPKQASPPPTATTTVCTCTSKRLHIEAPYSGRPMQRCVNAPPFVCSSACAHVQPHTCWNMAPIFHGARSICKCQLLSSTPTPSLSPAIGPSQRRLRLLRNWRNNPPGMGWCVCVSVGGGGWMGDTCEGVLWNGCTLCFQISGKIL